MFVPFIPFYHFCLSPTSNRVRGHSVRFQAYRVNSGTLNMTNHQQNYPVDIWRPIHNLWTNPFAHVNGKQPTKVAGRMLRRNLEKRPTIP